MKVFNDIRSEDIGRGEVVQIGKGLVLDDDFRVDYLNLEHWTEPLRVPERLLYAYSQFVKGEIDAYTLLKLYRMIQAEAAAEDERKMLKSYLRDDVWSKYYSL